MSKGKRRTSEQYELKSSPLAQKLTQQELANLLKVKKSHLKSLIANKEKWVVRRIDESGKKTRNLVYPKGDLRRVHERLKFHLCKIKQPEYLFSPRKGRSQRDNASAHLNRQQYLKVDIKQFYPSTTAEHIFRWAKYTVGMKDDVAGLFTKLVTIDDQISFGSPLSPVLVTLVHRPMFDQIYRESRRRGLRMSLWVDDMVISGRYVPGEFLDCVREIVRCNGLRSHKIHFLTGKRPVNITGIPVVGKILRAPRSLHDRILESFCNVHISTTKAARLNATEKLLSALGSFRYIVGSSTPQGRKAADRMNSLRQKRASLSLKPSTNLLNEHDFNDRNSKETPF